VFHGEFKPLPALFSLFLMGNCVSPFSPLCLSAGKLCFTGSSNHYQHCSVCFTNKILFLCFLHLIYRQAHFFQGMFSILPALFSFYYASNFVFWFCRICLPVTSLFHGFSHLFTSVPMFSTSSHTVSHTFHTSTLIFFSSFCSPCKL
jgi:hypothetical protein